MHPPKALDGATVVFWAWAEPAFFEMPWDDEPIAIHGLAVCRYESGAVYRFSCDAHWEVQNDAPYASVDEAKTARSGQYEIANVRWRAP